MSSKLIIRVALAGALALTALTAAASSAHATYPGNNNGRLAFGITANGNTDVYSVLPNGQALRRLTDDPGFDACPAYSADGESIAWCGPGGIWLMNQDGTEKRQLTTRRLPRHLPRRQQGCLQRRAERIDQRRRLDGRHRHRQPHATDDRAGA